MWDQFVTFLNTGRYTFLMTCCHSPGGDTAAFYTTYIQSPEGDSAIALAEFAFSECSCFTFVSFSDIIQTFRYVSVYSLHC